MSFFGNPLKPRHDKSVQRLINQANACMAGLNGLLDKAVREAEEQGDEERRLLIDELNRTFVTPIDREDLFALSRAIDDILDYAYTAVDEMVLFRLDADPYVAKMAETLQVAGKEIHMAMMRILEHPQVANEHAVRAKQAENKVEQLYREAIAELFDRKVESFDAVMKTFKMREVYRHLSNAADRIDTAGNIITDVIMKVM
jgi:uncharacterized protein Yka (UPF0111/DUF47 family)